VNALAVVTWEPVHATRPWRSTDPDAWGHGAPHLLSGDGVRVRPAGNGRTATLSGAGGQLVESRGLSPSAGRSSSAARTAETFVVASTAAEAQKEWIDAP